MIDWFSETMGGRLTKAVQLYYPLRLLPLNSNFRITCLQKIVLTRDQLCRWYCLLPYVQRKHEIVQITNVSPHHLLGTIP